MAADGHTMAGPVEYPPSPRLGIYDTFSSTMSLPPRPDTDAASIRVQDVSSKGKVLRGYPEIDLVVPTEGCDGSVETGARKLNEIVYKTGNEHVIVDGTGTRRLPSSTKKRGLVLNVQNPTYLVPVACSCLSLTDLHIKAHKFITNNILAPNEQNGADKNEPNDPRIHIYRILVEACKLVKRIHTEVYTKKDNSSSPGDSYERSVLKGIRLSELIYKSAMSKKIVHEMHNIDDNDRINSMSAQSDKYPGLDVALGACQQIAEWVHRAPYAISFLWSEIACVSPRGQKRAQVAVYKIWDRTSSGASRADDLYKYVMELFDAVMTQNFMEKMKETFEKKREHERERARSRKRARDKANTEAKSQ